MKKSDKQYKKRTHTSMRAILIYMIILLIEIIILSVSMVQGISITEIMFNPQGSDSGREWIEITLNESDGCVNLSAYKLFEDETNHKIYPYNNEIACNHAIICSDVNKFLQNYSYLNNTILSIYKSTFSLSNSGEEISLKLENTIMDIVNYTNILLDFEVSEGYSLEKKENKWKVSEYIAGDPGDFIEEAIDESDSNNNTNYTDYEINNTTIDNTTMENITIDNTTINITINITLGNITDNATDIIYDENITENITDTITNSTINISNNIICYASIDIIIKNELPIYDNGLPVQFYNKIAINNSLATETLNYSIDYWIEDLSGNIIRNKITTANQNEKTFTPKIDESDKILLIKNSLSNINCNITKNYSEKILIVRNKNYTAYIPAKVTCPKCETQTTKCTDYSTYTADTNLLTYNQNCTQKPLIKIIRECNDTQSISQKIQELGNTNYTHSVYISTTTNKTNNSKNLDQTTSMIIYESPNVQNRFYALIGLLLVGLMCTGIIVYKFFNRKPEDKIV